MTDQDMKAYAIIEKAKASIFNMLDTTGLVDMGELSDEDLREAVSFIYSVDKSLLNDGTDEEKINRLRNLCLSLFALVQTGGAFKP